MKTASELALEYWDKPPIERVNTTLQDYVYDYMFEKLSEKQNKIDATVGEISRALNCCESIETECVLVEIKELLK